MKAEDFTSAPGATMQSVREEAAREVRTYIAYLNQTIKAARKCGLDVHVRINNEGDHRRSEATVMSILCHETHRF